jgi:hypothetical protein
LGVALENAVFVLIMSLSSDQDGREEKLLQIMRSRSGTVNRLQQINTGYPNIQESSLRMTNNFALNPEYATS